MTQQVFEQELQKIEKLLKTPVKERPKYKAFLEQVKQMVEAEQATEYEPKWMREAHVWMANRKNFQRIAEEESICLLNQAKYLTHELFSPIIKLK